MSEIRIEILETEVVKQNKRLLSLPNKVSEKKLNKKNKIRDANQAGGEAWGSKSGKEMRRREKKVKCGAGKQKKGLVKAQGRAGINRIYGFGCAGGRDCIGSMLRKRL